MPEPWQRHPFGWKTVLVFLGLSVLLAFSAHRTGVDRGAALTVEGALAYVGLLPGSKAADGIRRFLHDAFPLAVDEKQEYDASAKPPAFSHMVTEPVRRYDATADRWIEEGTRTFSVQPFGYLWYVLGLMLQTLEMAFWGTFLAVIFAAPIAYFSTTGYTPFRFLYHISRAVSSFLRAVPELISAMFFVLLYGFGSVAGILALALHSAGFLGKFFADDVENADQGPQVALLASGARRIDVFLYAVLPQVFPQYLAYLQYILERNVRTATVLGIVGAGGIGMELKGRWDLSDFSHVSTILLVVFIVVFLLEQLTQALRRRHM